VESILGPLGTAAIYSSIVTAPGNCEDREVGGMNGGWEGKRKYSEKTCPAATSPTTIRRDYCGRSRVGTVTTTWWKHSMTKTQNAFECLQEFAAAIDHLAHHACSVSTEQLSSRGTACSFPSGVRARGHYARSSMGHSSCKQGI
jgi:hypothetical protein